MLDPQIISILLGLFVGFVLALTGAGGTILAVPLLAFSLHLSIATAAPIGLLAVALAAGIGAFQGIRAGIVRYKAAALMASCGIIFSPVGVWLAHRMPNAALSVIFSVVLIFVSWRMWQQSAQLENIDNAKLAPACAVNPATSKLFWTARCTQWLIVTGSFAGFISGLLGVGGGFVIVPTLKKFSNLALQSIVATSLAVVALVSTVSVAAYLYHQQLHWHIALPFTLATIAGMLAGRIFSGKISSQTVQRGFSLLAGFIALAVLFKVVFSAP
ncbi:MAG TPA: sulfite exporter TauE/SafE family protein [Methylotenera sp.]|nr:sulfite exporter TauE/SafE family protein [Methylotenera sp.]HPH06461.1 sulfite exporter TauE/SafE family protein [Methylotenera sp.]HPN01222.1 sulfite exporter TauE/SafE family protein [Methylotenera sp.]